MNMINFIKYFRFRFRTLGLGGTFETIREQIQNVLEGIKDNIGHLNYTLPLAEARNTVQDFTDNVDYWEVRTASGI